jgi:hypothetical protein
LAVGFVSWIVSLSLETSRKLLAVGFVSWIVSLSCVIDYVSYLRPKNPSGGVKENYKPILDDYLRKIDGRYNSARIYALRCALVHTYAEAKEMKRANVRGYLFKHKDPSFHLSGSDGILRLNADTFVADVTWAVHLAFDANRGDSLLIVNVPSAQLVSRDYASFHRALAEFDAASPNLSRLRRAITDLYP